MRLTSPETAAWWSRAPRADAAGQPIGHLLTPSPSRKSRARELVPEAFFLLVTTAVGLWAGGRWLNPIGDPGVWWSAAYRLSQGERLYRDIYLQYGPLSPYLLALSVRVFGASARTFLFVNWIPAIVAGLLLLRLGRIFLNLVERLALVGLLLGLSIFAPGTGRLVYPYCPAAVHAVAFSTGALLLFTRSAVRRSSWVACSGALVGLAFCSKQEIGLAAGIALVLAFCLSGRDGLRPLARFLAGFAVILLTGAAVVLSSASLPSLLWRSHVWPLKLGLTRPWMDLSFLATGMSRPGWAALVRGSALVLLGLVLAVAVISLLLAREFRLSRWIPVLALVAVFGLWWGIEGAFLGAPAFLPLSLSAGVALLVPALAVVDHRLAGRESIVAVGLFAGLTGMRTAFSIDVGGPFAGVAHFAAALTWVIFLCLLVPRLLVRNEKGATYARAAFAAALLVVGFSAAVEGALAIRSPSAVAVATRRGNIYVTPEQAPFFSLLSRNLRPGERALILPEINALDVLFGVRSASPYLAHMPGLLDPDAERELVEKLKREPPDVVVVFNRPLWEFRVAPFGRGFGWTVADWLFRNYRAVQHSAGGTILRK